MLRSSYVCLYDSYAASVFTLTLLWLFSLNTKVLKRHEHPCICVYVHIQLSQIKRCRLWNVNKIYPRVIMYPDFWVIFATKYVFELQVLYKPCIIHISMCKIMCSNDSIPGKYARVQYIYKCASYLIKAIL